MRRHPAELLLKRGRQGVTDLRLYNSRFDLRRTPSFETLEEVTAEDALRAVKLRRRALLVPIDEARELRRLADAIDPEVTAFPTTPASSRYMRQQRVKILGAVWEIASGSR